MKIDYSKLEKKIDYKFKNKNLLVQSLTHKSFNKINNNEIELDADLFSLDGKKRYNEKKFGAIESAGKLGQEVGINLKKRSNNLYKK